MSGTAKGSREILRSYKNFQCDDELNGSAKTGPIYRRRKR